MPSPLPKTMGWPDVGAVMDVVALASLATEMQSARLGQDVGIAVLKKVLDTEASSAAQLLQALPAANNLPPNLGQNINTTA